MLLVIFFTVGSSILLVPSYLAHKVNQDAWIACLLGTIIGFFGIWMFTTIAGWFPGLSIVEINNKVFGRWIGKIVSLICVCITLIFTAVLLKHCSLFLNSQMLPNTPAAVLTAFKALIIVIAVRYGLVTFARSAEITLFFFTFFLFILIFFTIPKINIHNLLPLFQDNIGTYAESSLLLVVLSSFNSVVLLMIYPKVEESLKKARYSFYMGYIIGSIIIFIITILCILVLSAPTTARLVYPSYYLAKQINIGESLTRVEALMATVWILTMFFKIVIYFYASLQAISQIFQLKDYRTLTFPVGTICVVLSLIMFPNVVKLNQFDESTGISMGLLFGFFLPFLLMIIYLIRKKSIKRDSSNSQPSI